MRILKWKASGVNNKCADAKRPNVIHFGIEMLFMLHTFWWFISLFTAIFIAPKIFSFKQLRQTYTIQINLDDSDKNFERNRPKSQSLIWMLPVTNRNRSSPFSYTSTSTLTSLINQFSKEMSKWHTFLEWIYSMQSIICFKISFTTLCHSKMSTVPSLTEYGKQNTDHMHVHVIVIVGINESTNVRMYRGFFAQNQINNLHRLPLPYNTTVCC